MKKTKATPPASSAIPEALIRIANERIDLWLAMTGLTVQSIASGDKLSVATINRIRHPLPDKGLDMWLCELQRILRRLDEVAENEHKASTGGWSYFFGSAFPMPPFGLSASAFNYADVDRQIFKNLAQPLIDFLLERARSADQQKNVWKASDLYNHACALLERTNQWGQAEINLGNLAKLNTDTGDFHFAANALLRRGQAQLRAGFPDRADESFLTGIKLITQNKGKTPPFRVHLRLLNYQALVLRAKGDLLKALDKLKNESLPMADDHCSRAAFASVINRIAMVECELKDFVSAYNHILKAIEIRLKFNMRSEAARSLLILGTIHEGNGEQEKALFVWELALRWQQYLGDDESMPETLFRIGSLYRNLIAANSEKNITTIEPTLRRFSGLPEFELLSPIAKETGFEGIQVKISALRQSARNACVRCAEVEQRLGGQGEYTDRANELLRGL